MSSPQNPPATVLSGERTPPQAYYALGILLAAYILSFIDRNVMAVLIGPIRDDLSITDFQYSLLHGFAFSMFYIVLGIPIARLADRANRKWIITIGVFLWSIMTCVCGLAKTVTTLFIARIGVGVGEAALSPPAFSMLTDLFPPEKLARAFAIYTLGVTLGGGLSYIVGSQVYGYFAATGGAVLPLFGEVKAWQMTFIAVGLPGFLIVGLLSLIKEPERRTDRDIVQTSEQASLAEVGAHLAKHKRIYIGVIGANSMLTVLTYGMMAWYPEFLIRTYGMERAVAGSQFGLIFIISGSLGAIAAGWLVQPLIKRGIIDAPIRIVVGIACLTIPLALAPLSPSATLAAWLACPVMFLLNSFYGPGLTALQMITPNSMKAQITAITLFFANLFGLAMGPTIVAVFTDFVFGSDTALRYSLALVLAIFAPLAAVLAMQAMKPYKALLGASDK